MNPPFTRRTFLAASVATLACGTARGADAPHFDFYAMDTGLRGPDVPTLEDKVKLLKELGYWGIDYTLDHRQLPRLLELLDNAKIRLACVYLSPTLGEKPDPRLADSIKLMKRRSTRVELAVQSKKFTPSDTAGDEQGLELIKRVSDLCADLGPVVSIYPHTGAWTERVQDGVRLARLSGRENVGTNFNLVHWSWVKQDEPLEKVLEQSLPFLKAVSINGLDGRKIVPLDEGNYDVAAFVRTLGRINYRGPVGFQGYGIPGPSRVLLERSMRKWEQIQATPGF